MKVLKWILWIAAAAASAFAVVYAVFYHADKCRSVITNLLKKSKAVAVPCYERVLGFFFENDFIETGDDTAQ